METYFIDQGRLLSAGEASVQGVFALVQGSRYRRP